MIAPGITIKQEPTEMAPTPPPLLAPAPTLLSLPKVQSPGGWPTKHAFNSQLSPIPTEFVSTEPHNTQLGSRNPFFNKQSKRSKSSGSEDESDSSRSNSPKIPRKWLQDAGNTTLRERLAGMKPQSKPKMKTNAYDEMVEASSKYDANFLNKFGLKDVKTEKKTTYYEYKGKDEPQQLPKKKKNISGSKSDKNESILRKVNEIIKSCVELKESKKITGEKLKQANLIIEKANEKQRKLLGLGEKVEVEEGEISGSEQDDNEVKRNLIDILAKNIEEDQKNKKLAQLIRKPSTDQFKERSPFKRMKRGRSPSSSKSTSRSKSWTRKRSFSRGRSPSRRHSPSPRRSFSRRSWSRGRSRSTSRGRRRSQSSDRFGRKRRTHYMVSRSRSRSRGRSQKKITWIAVSPCVIMDNLTLEEDSKRSIQVVQKDQYYFPDNAGFMVKITKWTGQDHVQGIHISEQIVSLDEKRDIDVVVENPYDNKQLKLEKMDKVACLSIFSTPIPRFSNSLSPQR